MRYLTLCDVRLHPSTAAETFERAMLGDVLPGAGGGALPPSAVRGLYRAAGDGFPPAYRCLMLSTEPAGEGFFGMRRRIDALGARTCAPRSRPVAGTLPGEAEAVLALGAGTSPTLVMVEVHRSLRLIPDDFELPLHAALAAQVGVATRVNNVRAAFWTRDEGIAVPGRTEYLIATIGAFMRPDLGGAAQTAIREAGGEVAESAVFHHVGTVSGGQSATVPAAGG